MSEVQVAVWDYAAQTFIQHIPCPGERRVRVDYHGNLLNLDVFEVRREGNLVYPVDGTKPLDWRIDLS